MHRARDPPEAVLFVNLLGDVAAESVRYRKGA